MSVRDEVVRDWILARKVIMGFLAEIRPDFSQEVLEHNAAAIIARLAQASLTIENTREEK